jgi:hypothetical protein
LRSFDEKYFIFSPNQQQKPIFKISNPACGHKMFLNLIFISSSSAMENDKGNEIRKWQWYMDIF